MFNPKILSRALLNSFFGIKFAFCEEHAFREISIQFLIGIAIILYLDENFVTSVLLLLPFFICFIVELLNTAIENICDKITTEYDLFIKKAKDMGSAAQLISQIFLYMTWLLYFINRP